MFEVRKRSGKAEELLSQYDVSKGSSYNVEQQEVRFRFSFEREGKQYCPERLDLRTNAILENLL
jgi:hypothetical protein